jgi:hypothetical protein
MERCYQMRDHRNTPLPAAESTRDDPSKHDTAIQRKSTPEDGTGAFLVFVWLELNFAALNACEVSVALTFLKEHGERS